VAKPKLNYVDKAKFWLNKSANAGYPDAEFFLASINRDKAAIEKYANQGDTYSLFNMGVLWSGYDMSEAFNWFNQAFKTRTSPKYNWDDRAEGKDINIYAQYNLGVMYAEGELDTGINMDKARKRIKHVMETDMSDSGIPLANWQKYKFDN